MTSLIVVHADFDGHWPFVADHLEEIWRADGPAALIRLGRGDTRRLGELPGIPEGVRRLAVLGVSVTAACLNELPALREAAILTAYGTAQIENDLSERLRSQGVTLHAQHSEGFWGESVAEFALALTICGLRRIPQSYHAMLTGHEVWERYRADRNRGPGQVGAQFSDDVRFTNGTICGKRVRIVGAGNIGSRYAHYTHTLGAEVAAWDPYAADPAFHRSGARRIWRLEELMEDAEIFAPMVPLTSQTRGLVTAEHIRALPAGCLIVLATRAMICDMEALRARVVADEVALAADVFDVEPLPLDDPLLGRHNVVHTPHLAGRTRDANFEWAEELAAKFLPVGKAEPARRKRSGK